MSALTDMNVLRVINELKRLVKHQELNAFEEFFMDYLKVRAEVQLDYLKNNRIIFDYKVFTRNKNEFDVWIQPVPALEHISINFVRALELKEPTTYPEMPSTLATTLGYTC